MIFAVKNNLFRFAVDTKKYNYEMLIISALGAGAFFGLLMGFVLGWVWDHSVSLKEGAFKWQTLLAGVIAFFASLIVFMSAVISDFKDRKSRLFVSRAFLSHSLSDLNVYLQKCIKSYFEILIKFKLENYNPGLLDNKISYVNKDVYDDIRIVMGHADKDVSNILKGLVSDLQIVSSRLSNLYWEYGEEQADGIGEDYIYSCIYSTAYLSALVGRLYKYSRTGVMDVGHISYQEISNTLGILGFILSFPANFELDEYIRYAMDKSRSPLNGFFN